MKPNPFPLIGAAEQMQMDVTHWAALIGDSLTDNQAAHAAGSMVIGYAQAAHVRSVRGSGNRCTTA